MMIKKIILSCSVSMKQLLIHCKFYTLTYYLFNPVVFFQSGKETEIERGEPYPLHIQVYRYMCVCESGLRV